MIKGNNKLGPFIYGFRERLKQFEQDLDWVSKNINKEFHEMRKDFETGQCKESDYLAQLKNLKSLFANIDKFKIHSLDVEGINEEQKKLGI